MPGRVVGSGRVGYARQMVDIHCHILPALDDGARSLDESVAMAEMAISEGITHVVGTPHADSHFRFDFALVQKRRAELQARVGERLQLVVHEVPGAHVARLFLGPDDLRGGGVAGQDIAGLRGVEGIKLFDAHQGHGEFVPRAPNNPVNRALSTWKEISAPRTVERAGIPATGV